MAAESQYSIDRARELLAEKYGHVSVWPGGEIYVFGCPPNAVGKNCWYLWGDIRWPETQQKLAEIAKCRDQVEQEKPATNQILESLEAIQRDLRILNSVLAVFSAIDCVNQTRLSEELLTDIAELLRTHVRKIWDDVDEVYASIRADASEALK